MELSIDGWWVLCVPRFPLKDKSTRSIALGSNPIDLFGAVIPVSRLAF